MYTTDQKISIICFTRRLFYVHILFYALSNIWSNDYLSTFNFRWVIIINYFDFPNMQSMLNELFIKYLRLE